MAGMGRVASVDGQKQPQKMVDKGKRDNVTRAVTAEYNVIKTYGIFISHYVIYVWSADCSPGSCDLYFPILGIVFQASSYLSSRSS